MLYSFGLFYTSGYTCKVSGFLNRECFQFDAKTTNRQFHKHVYFNQKRYMKVIMCVIYSSVIPLWSQPLSSLVVSAELSLRSDTPYIPVRNYIAYLTIERCHRIFMKFGCQCQLKYIVASICHKPGVLSTGTYFSLKLVDKWMLIIMGCL